MHERGEVSKQHWAREEPGELEMGMMAIYANANANVNVNVNV